MLCLERAVSLQNELHHFFGEVAVPHKLFGVAELLVEHEVNIAVFCVPENDRVLVAVGVKERGQIATGSTEHVHRDHHILKQRIRAGGAVARDRGVQPAPRSPERITLRKFAGHFDRRHHRESIKHRCGGSGKIGELLLRVSLKFHKQSRMLAHINSSKSLRCLPGALRHTNTGGIHELNRRQVVSHKLGHGTGCV